MKKTILAIFLALASNTFSYHVVSDYKPILNNFFFNKKILKKIEGRFDYSYDLAVISDGKDTKDDSWDDAMNGLEKITREYSKDLLDIYLSRANVQGPGFNDTKMNDFSKQIAKDFLTGGRLKKEIVLFDTDEKKYYTLVKINKAFVQEETKKVFAKRLAIVIQELQKLEEGLKNDKS